MYAIVETGGKQYKVSPGESLKVEVLDVAEGGTVELDRVLAIGDGEKLVVGKPVIEGAKVFCTSKGDGLCKKVIGGKYKAKTRYFRKIGHRQAFTEITVDSISGAGMESEAPKVEATAKPRRRTTKKEVTENGS